MLVLATSFAIVCNLDCVHIHDKMDNQVHFYLYHKIDKGKFRADLNNISFVMAPSIVIPQDYMSNLHNLC